MSRPHVDKLFAMSREMSGQSVDIDFGKHLQLTIFCFEFWVSVLARLGAAVQIESTLKAARSEAQTTGSFLTGR